MHPLKRILLAEDNQDDVELTLRGLADSGLANEVIVVRDGVEALDYLFRREQYADRESGDPAVVLLDNKMPRLTGLDVLEAVRADPSLKTIPVVILTSSREERDVFKSYELGANAYVVKPVTLPEFLTAVRTLGLFWAVINEPPIASLPKP